MQLIPDILYEDEVLLVVNKPAGMVVNRAESVGEGSSLQDWVEANLKSMENADEVFRQRAGIAHRLDKETSGCLVIAKNPEALMDLMRQFKNREVSKQYLSLVHGLLEPREGGWRLPLARSPFNRTEFKVDPFGKPAETSYRVERYFPGLTLIRLYPKTGRTHQLRVHCKHMKHPIVADDKYLTEKMYLEDSRWCPRLFLHAQEIRFTHPETRQVLTIDAPLPHDLQTVLTNLKPL